jgi:hypothetical protein
MILESWVSTYLRANSTIRFVISSRLKGISGKPANNMPVLKEGYFLLAADYLSTKSFTLQTDMQEGDNTTP